MQEEMPLAPAQIITSSDAPELFAVALDRMGRVACCSLSGVSKEARRTEGVGQGPRERRPGPAQPCPPTV